MLHDTQCGLVILSLCAAPSRAYNETMRSNVFDIEELDLAGTREQVLVGGRGLFTKLGDAFAGIERIGVIGWGPQGRAQALNLRDSLAPAGITVTVGLREESASWDDARREGFSELNGTLGEMFEVIGASDLVLLLIADAALVARCEGIFRALKPGAVIGLAHGFLVAYLETTGDRFPDR